MANIEEQRKKQAELEADDQLIITPHPIRGGIAVAEPILVHAQQIPNGITSMGSWVISPIPARFSEPRVIPHIRFQREYKLIAQEGLLNPSLHSPGFTPLGRMVGISDLIQELQETSKKFGDTCVYIRDMPWGSHALAKHDDDRLQIREARKFLRGGQR